MKKIIFLIITLIVAIISMAYLYFSGLNSKLKNNDSSLYAATFNSSFVFSFENEKSILDILKSQDLFREMIGQDKFSELESIKGNLLQFPELNKAIDNQVVYISLIPGKDKKIDFLYSTQLNAETDKTQLLKSLKARTISISSKDNLTSVTLSDSSQFYIGIKDNLVLLSSQSQCISEILKATFDKNNPFVEFIKSTSRITKNSLAELYINYETLPPLLKSLMPGKLSGELSPLSQQRAFASFSYNFSKERILLTGLTTAETSSGYYRTFSDIDAQKITITNILPDNTANYTTYAINDYLSWQKSLHEWFKNIKEDKLVSNRIKSYSEKYRIDLNNLIPKYFKNQFITFQLSTSEKIGAVELTNGDKLNQLLIDLSTDYSTDIKTFKDEDLLYAFFGEPMKKFKRPSYCIIDNYLVFANNPSTIQSFLNSYKNNRLLIDDIDYSNAVNQLANSASLSFYIGMKNSSDIFMKNIYLPYYRHIRDENGLKNYTAFIYQLSGDKGKFQTNVLIDKKTTIDSLTSNP